MANKKLNVIYSCSLIAVIATIAAFYLATVFVFPMKYTDEIIAAAKAYDLDANLIRAVIWTESKFDENALSGKGASGLMQMMPATRAEQSVYSGITADGTPASEIMLGSGYLARLSVATGDIDTALMAYNAGLKNVMNWDEPFPESAEYLKRVNFAKNIYIYLK